MNMKRNVKTRNFVLEAKFNALIDALVMLFIILCAWLALPETGPIGYRTMAIMNLCDVAITFMFMYLFEKYEITLSGLYEKNVINVLSAVYSFIITSIVNVLFFTSMPRLIFDVSITAAEIVCLIITDCILNAVLNNERFRKKPKLLIIDVVSKNFNRMKRIKYGVLKYYDSWYENAEELKNEGLDRFLNDRFTEFDAVCILDGLDDDMYRKIVKAAIAANKDLYIAPKLIDIGRTNVKTVRFDDVLTLYMPKHSLTKAELFVKRLADLAISVPALIIAAIPMAVIAVAIKLTSPGPVFYKQERYTLNKRRFNIYKFRTMIPDAEKLSGPKFAEKDDPRITKIGKFLRACRLDELPQIINIIKGDMSVVGPRPERPIFADEFEKEIENYGYRYEVKAGLTSLSHVYGRYSTYIHDRTYYDLLYITHYSLLLDFKIILLTTKTIFLKSAAEGEDEYKEKTDTTIKDKDEVQAK